MSEETKALVPIEEKQVDFYGDDITAALVPIEDSQQVFVPVRPICDYLGLSWSGQRERINRDPVLFEALRFVRMTRTNMGGNPDLLCLPLDYIPGWLFGVDTNRVKAELKDKIIRYRKECFRVLWQAFQAETLSFVEQSAQVPSSGLVQIREMGLAIVRMAEEQMAMEKRLNSRLDQAALAFKALDQRVTGIEKKLTPASLITDAQATEVAQSVKALAEYLTTRDKSKNHYQAVFSEIYRRFSVSSYKNIRADQFGAVLKFLEDWQSKFRNDTKE